MRTNQLPEIGDRFIDRSIGKWTDSAGNTRWDYCDYVAIITEVDEYNANWKRESIIAKRIEIPSGNDCSPDGGGFALQFMNEGKRIWLPKQYDLELTAGGQDAFQFNWGNACFEIVPEEINGHVLFGVAISNQEHHFIACNRAIEFCIAQELDHIYAEQMTTRYCEYCNKPEVMQDNLCSNCYYEWKSHNEGGLKS